MKTLWKGQLPDTLQPANFADWVMPGGVGTLARSLGPVPPQTGDAIGQTLRPDSEFSTATP